LSASGPLRLAVVGAGSIGEHRVRIAQAAPGVEVAGIVDARPERAREVGERYGAPVWSEADLARERIDAAVVSVPTNLHAAVAAPLLERGVSVLIEKPIAASLEEADRLIALAGRRKTLLQVGQTERFNPAVGALRRESRDPRFIEAHRLSSFQPRSLDVDVILDLMIHDIDVVLDLVPAEIDRIDAVGVAALTSRLDIANARLVFRNGAAANLTASRISVGKVRKLRVFESDRYLSLDYTQQEVLHYSVSRPAGDSKPQITSSALAVERAEPLALELASFFACVRTGAAPRVDGRQGRRALDVALEVARRVGEGMERGRAGASGR
jgi:predicted dehydrogenase